MCFLRGGVQVRSEPAMIVVAIAAVVLAVLLELVHQQGEQLERALDLPEVMEGE